MKIKKIFFKILIIFSFFLPLIFLSIYFKIEQNFFNKILGNIVRLTDQDFNKKIKVNNYNVFIKSTIASNKGEVLINDIKILDLTKSDFVKEPAEVIIANLDFDKPSEILFYNFKDYYNFKYIDFYQDNNSIKWCINKLDENSLLAKYISSNFNYLGKIGYIISLSISLIFGIILTLIYSIILFVKFIILKRKKTAPTSYNSR